MPGGRRERRGHGTANAVPCPRGSPCPPISCSARATNSQSVASSRAHQPRASHASPERLRYLDAPRVPRGRRARCRLGGTPRAPPRPARRTARRAGVPVGDRRSIASRRPRHRRELARRHGPGRRGTPRRHEGVGVRPGARPRGAGARREHPHRREHAPPRRPPSRTPARRIASWRTSVRPSRA